jgi:hypothetical protein
MIAAGLSWYDAPDGASLKKMPAMSPGLAAKGSPEEL